MSAHVALALLALGTPGAGPGTTASRAGTAEDRGAGEAQRAETRIRDVTTAIAALAAQFRESGLATRKAR